MVFKINKRGQVGQILTSFPSLILIVLLMIVFGVISGFMADNLGSKTYKEYSLEERIALETKYPSKNAGKDSLIDEFLNSEILVEGELVNVRLAIERACITFSSGNEDLIKNIGPVLKEKFSHLSLKGSFMIVLGKFNSDWFEVHVFSDNLKDLETGEILSNMDLGIKFTFPESFVSSKTICGPKGEFTWMLEPTYLYVYDEEN